MSPSGPGDLFEGRVEMTSRISRVVNGAFRKVSWSWKIIGRLISCSKESTSILDVVQWRHHLLNCSAYYSND